MPLLSSEDSLKTAAKTMRQTMILGLPVVDSRGKPIGVITDGDILNAFYLNVSSFSYEEKPGGERDSFAKRIREFHSLKVKDVMTFPARVINQNAKVDEAATQLKRFKIKRLVVVDDDGKVIGVVSRLHVVESILEE